jgi:hypothetical protein
MRRFLLPIAAALVVGACGDDDGGAGPGGSGGAVTYPLAVGNRWTYSGSSDTSRATSHEDTTTVSGTQMFNGQLYYVLTESGSGGGDQTLIRQQGQDLLVVPDFAVGTRLAGGDPLDTWLQSVLDGSLPWKYADFDAPSGSTWSIAQAETVVDFGRVAPETVRVNVTGTSRGRTSVTVPAGTFADTYEGALQLSVTSASQPALTLGQTLFVKDGVGLVRSINMEPDESSGGSATVTDTDDLTGYQFP